MNRENLESSLEGIRKLLTGLYGEVAILEESYSRVLQVVERLEGVCQIDDLTGLKRRNAFFQKWEMLLDECRRLNEACGVLLIDIDHFKWINDTYGHPAGDDVIRNISALLKRYESPDCVAGRYGGEEFILAVKANGSALLGLAEKIRSEVEELHGTVSPGVEWRCTVSVGTALSSRIGLDATQLLQAADKALYVAKRGGRNQVNVA